MGAWVYVRVGQVREEWCCGWMERREAEFGESGWTGEAGQTPPAQSCAGSAFDWFALTLDRATASFGISQSCCQEYVTGPRKGTG